MGNSVLEDYERDWIVLQLIGRDLLFYIVLESNLLTAAHMQHLRLPSSLQAA